MNTAARCRNGQDSLFCVTRTRFGETYHVPVEPGVVQIEPHVADAADKARLTDQNARVLERLRQGPATGVELAAISLKYTSRVSEVRAYLARCGMTVVCRRHQGGQSVYLIEKASK
ncbi:MAG: hypothetical protein ABFD92_16740 [Planctomycetaceae bacterium]|nr:hypothetical protein [Planctomycetaceae bacterium]